jgi:hypothetical protein
MGTPIPELYEGPLAKLKVGDNFPAAKLLGMDGATVEFPGVFCAAPATVVFFYRGRW